ncbi:MAG: ATPase [Chlamydiae bacterium]|nr:ATPase [Chlamydiota bacterium]
MARFVGREQELRKLTNLLDKDTASLVVIRGRRRVGKSRLIQEFSQGKKFFSFSGIPPTEKTTDESQRKEFAEQMALQLKMPVLNNPSWNDLFWHLGEYLQRHSKSREKILVVLDEISWIGSKDPDFLGKLKNLWDYKFSLIPQVICIFCGSVSLWIEENILSSTGFLGRVSLSLVLHELPLKDCALFWGKNVSSYEIFKVLAVTGGVPKYLEEVNPKLSAEENIRRLCFQPDGLLFREFDQIFSDLFFKKTSIFKQIVQQLAEGARELDAICSPLQKEKGGNISRYLRELALVGFVSVQETWNLKTKKISSLKKYKLSDNYLRFYLKYVSPYRDQIEKGLFHVKTLSSLPGWNSIMGLQFENLVLSNYLRVIELLHIDPNDVLQVGPFFQNPTKRQSGCQIDLLIQTRYGCLYPCEVKFYVEKINVTEVSSFQKALKNLSLARGMSVRPVLIHCNGVQDSVCELELFDYILDFSDLLMRTQPY